MTICAVKFCCNHSGKHKKSDNITYHRFPSDPVIASRWIQKIRLSRNEEWWKPTRDSRICSVHFNEEDKYFTKNGFRKLRPNAVPTKSIRVIYLENDDEAEPSSEKHQLKKNTKEDLSDKKPEEIVSGINSSNENHTNALDITEEPSSSLDISDEELESYFDTPEMTKMRNQLEKRNSLQLKHDKLIRALRQQNRRLKQDNDYLKKMLEESKQQSVKTCLCGRTLADSSNPVNVNEEIVMEKKNYVNNSIQ